MGFDSGKGFSGGGSGGGGTYSIVGVVANYSALPSPASATNKFYWVENSQGTAWLPWSLGGTYYNNGLYYSNGVSWENMDVPYQATQSEVNTGTNNDKFVTPATFTNATKWSTKQDTLVSGVNIKTINGNDILGSGNLVISATATNDYTQSFLLGGM